MYKANRPKVVINVQIKLEWIELLTILIEFVRAPIQTSLKLMKRHTNKKKTHHHKRIAEYFSVCGWKGNRGKKKKKNFNIKVLLLFFNEIGRAFWRLHHNRATLFYIKSVFDFDSLLIYCICFLMASNRKKHIKAAKKTHKVECVYDKWMWMKRRGQWGKSEHF